MADKVIRITEASFIQRKCAHCEEEEKAKRKPLAFIQKKEIGNNIASDSISHQIQSTKGSGNKIPETTKSFMENRFGANFSNINIHTGNYASQLSSQLIAQAFTVGNDIYFNTNKYSPETDAGKFLLAHELTHTLQQSSGSLKLQRSITCDGTPTAPPRAAQSAGRNTVDARAQAIINIAASSDPIATKAVNIVTQIICQYYPSQASTVDSIRHDATLASGLETQSSGSGATSTGIIKVSNQFVNDTNTAGIARRILQVGHELQHIQQFRSGLGGHNNQPEREFLSFYDESLGDEFEGTARMQQGTRLNLVDGAIRNYFCMSASLQTQYASRLTNLRARRQTIISTGRVRNPGAEPTSC